MFCRSVKKLLANEPLLHLCNSELSFKNKCGNSIFVFCFCWHFEKQHLKDVNHVKPTGVIHATALLTGRTENAEMFDRGQTLFQLKLKKIVDKIAQWLSGYANSILNCCSFTEWCELALVCCGFGLLYSNNDYSTVPGEKSTSLADKGALSVLKNDKYSEHQFLTKEHGIQLMPRLWETFNWH